jgi:acyl carrier protein
MTGTGERELIRAFIIEKLAGRKGRKEIDDTSDLISSGVVDSLGLMQLIAFLEERLGIKVNDEDVTPDNFESVDAILSFLGKKR